MQRTLKRVPLDFDYNNAETFMNQFEPPEGEGYQLWETVTEGSPISPVFETLDELCEWSEGNCTVFAGIKITKERWKEILERFI